MPDDDGVMKGKLEDSIGVTFLISHSVCQGRGCTHILMTEPVSHRNRSWAIPGTSAVTEAWNFSYRPTAFIPTFLFVQHATRGAG
jgi:hypothetical protein